jgi:hypothetical protein
VPFRSYNVHIPLRQNTQLGSADSSAEALVYHAGDFHVDQGVENYLAGAIVHLESVHSLTAPRRLDVH